MHPGRVAPCLALLLLAASPNLATAQEVDDDAWQREVDTLLSRWSNVEDRRLVRAVEILLAHLKDYPDDGTARLELARLELARDHCRAALLAADQARDGFAAQVTQRKEHAAPDDDVLERLEEQWHRSLALGFLAANYEVQQALDRISDKQDSERYLSERSGAVAERRQALVEAVQDPEQVKDLLTAESQRRLELRELPALGKPPRPLGQEDLDGKAVDFTRYDGRVVLVIFWSAQAPVADAPVEMSECAAVVDQVNALQQELADRLFVVVGVNLDKDREVFDAFVKEHHLEGWRHLFSGQGWANEDAQAWGVRSVPEGVLIDHTGRVRYVNPWGPNLRLVVEDLLSRRDEGR